MVDQNDETVVEDGSTGGDDWLVTIGEDESEDEHEEGAEDASGEDDGAVSS